MFGGFRLLLAILVALSHVNIRIAGLNPGVIAVVCFYLISGYVMTGLIRKHYDSVGTVKFFYLDRAIRLFPQYLVIVAITLCWFYVSGTKNNFLQHVPSLGDLLNNLVVVPLNYFMFNQSDQFTLIPPAWSLGAEIQFYILIPWLLMFRLRVASFVIAGAVYLAAAWGVLNTDTFGYRLLPGILVYFLLGSFLFDVMQQKRQPDSLQTNGSLKIIACVVLAVIAIAIVLSRTQHLHLLYNKETLIGMAFGVSCVVLLGKFRQTKMDNFLGDLSYGVFLNHFLIQWVLVGVPTELSTLALYVICSLILSALTQLIFEKPVLHLRQKFRHST
ncbi:acyltransferase family protein [Undibacterium sp. Di24W]|uniref:acyltransferase family protein n=1 Tax=Undibacterium sp. Di24W TaxID=3413033 RepID=UPI003BF2030C